jgi:NAD(P)-dependent dehydrogenase (short-subunit alcohol dehydrogenase family)
VTAGTNVPGMRFQGKRIFVTGAAAGIGAATVELFREEGATVYGVDVAEAEGVHRCDVTDPSSVRSAVDAAVAEMGGLDVLANVAGVNVFSKLEHMTLEVWNRHLAVNLTGPMLVTQACLPHLRVSKGNVVTVASISGIQGQPYNSSYCASKGGLRLFMKAIAVELAADGIRVNMVDPGGVDTAMSTNAMVGMEGQGDFEFSHFNRMMGVLPEGMMPPRRIAEALAFLASDASASTTGAEIVVDNGTLW